jgi:hypothetical protein
MEMESSLFRAIAKIEKVGNAVVRKADKFGVAYPTICKGFDESWSSGSIGQAAILWPEFSSRVWGTQNNAFGPTPLLRVSFEPPSCHWRSLANRCNYGIVASVESAYENL